MSFLGDKCPPQYTQQRHHREQGEHEGRETAIGVLPADGELNLDGIEEVNADLDEIFAINPASWSPSATSAIITAAPRNTFYQPAPSRSCR